ncbi:hypothetical protein LY76DRAFT_288156 [Colletotrichum caudatum]|nr:hypothetical protein LY76DRAFT_288156 [Colletotrichum caudatum]
MRCSQRCTYDIQDGRAGWKWCFSTVELEEVKLARRMDECMNGGCVFCLSFFLVFLFSCFLSFFRQRAETGATRKKETEKYTPPPARGVV